MTTEEAIFYLEAILDDTLDHHDETDAMRIEAVQVAIQALSGRKEAKAVPHGAGVQMASREIPFQDGLLALIDRSQSRTKTGNILNTSCTRWLRYRAFLGIIIQRYNDANTKFMSVVQRHMEAMSKLNGTRALTPEEIEELSVEAELGIRVHLEIESYYIFAKILLDRIADTFCYYFGVDSKHHQGSMHSFLASEYEKIKTEKGLTSDGQRPGKLLKVLKKKVVDYRTKAIEHEGEPRIIKGTLWGPTQKAGIMTTVLYPNDLAEDKRAQKQTEDLEQLLTEIDDYANAMIGFLEANAAQSTVGQRGPED